MNKTLTLLVVLLALSCSGLPTNCVRFPTNCIQLELPDGHAFPPVDRSGTNPISYGLELVMDDVYAPYSWGPSDYTNHIQDTNWMDACGNLYTAGFSFAITGRFNLGDRELVLESPQGTNWVGEWFFVEGYVYSPVDQDGLPLSADDGSLIQTNFAAIVYNSDGVPLWTNWCPLPKSSDGSSMFPNTIDTTNFWFPLLPGTHQVVTKPKLYRLVESFTVYEYQQYENMDGGDQQSAEQALAAAQASCPGAPLKCFIIPLGLLGTIIVVILVISIIAAMVYIIWRMIMNLKVTLEKNRPPDPDAPPPDPSTNAPPPGNGTNAPPPNP
jgi:hypothetical protein